MLVNRSVARRGLMVLVNPEDDILALELSHLKTSAFCPKLGGLSNNSTRDSQRKKTTLGHLICI
jgi:hypothetical protein